MSTEEEKTVDDLITKYDAHRLMHPKLSLPEVSENNRKFLIAGSNGTSGGFNCPEGLIPDDGYVFLGIWGNPASSQNKKFRNSIWYKCGLQSDFKNIDFTGARFIDCQLSNITFSRSNLTDVMFENCTFVREQMSGAIYENVKVIRPLFKGYDPVLDDLDQVNFGWKSWLFDWSSRPLK